MVCMHIYTLKKSVILKTHLGAAILKSLPVLRVFCPLHLSRPPPCPSIPPTPLIHGVCWAHHCGISRMFFPLSCDSACVSTCLALWLSFREAQWRGVGGAALRPAAFSEKMNLTLHAVLSWLTAITTLSESGTDVVGGAREKLTGSHSWEPALGVCGCVA